MLCKNCGKITEGHFEIIKREEGIEVIKYCTWCNQKEIIAPGEEIVTDKVPGY